MRLAVPLFPDRADVRSNTTRWSTDAIATRRPALIVGATIGTIALAVAVVVGAVPAAAAIGVALLIPAAVVDVEQRRLPDAWVVAAMGGLITTLAVGAAIRGTNVTGAELNDVVGGAITMAIPILTLHLVSPAAMGFGDVKASVVLGAAVGTIDWRLGAVALCVAAAVGATTGLVTRRRTIPFGPFLVFGAWLALLGHEPILETIFIARGTA